MQRPSQFPKIDNRSSHAPAPQVLGSLSSNTTDITERRLDTSLHGALGGASIRRNLQLLSQNLVEKTGTPVHDSADNFERH